MRECKCGEADPAMFSRDKRSPDGLRAKCKTCERLYKASRRDEDRKYMKRWRDANLEKARLACRLWAKNHPENVRARSRKRYAAHPDKAKAKTRKWRSENPEKIRQYHRNRRARELDSGGFVSSSEWLAVLERYGGKCLYPGCDRTDVTMDHVVPLALGGRHEIANVQPLCKSHNSKKYTRIIDYRTKLEAP